MKNARLARLALKTTENDALIVDALAEQLRGEPGPAVDALRERMKRRPTADGPKGNTGKLWRSYGPQSANRRDGVEVRQLQHYPRIRPRKQDEPQAWIVEFPPLAGGLKPCADLGELDSLVDAMELVDQRWPVPNWWHTIDTRSCVVGACDEPDDGIGFAYCELPSGHSDPHKSYTHDRVWPNHTKAKG